VGTAARILDLVVPERCAVCGRAETLLCAECAAGLTRVCAPLCNRCGAPSAWPVERCAECAGRRLPFRTARAAVVYDSVAKALVSAWKERGLRSLAGLAAGLVAEAVPRPETGGVTFVPGDRDRTLWRGENTAQALAGALGERWRLPVVPALRRTRRVPRQRGLSAGARRANVGGAFVADARVPPRILLVDDVYTTGATVSAAATELRRAGARSVEVVTFARAVRR
jgi:predicted amidophosphoribosyltransferase